MASQDWSPSGFTASRGQFQPGKLRTVLVANRGEIALRLLRAAKALDLNTVSVYTQTDEGAPHRAQADVSVLLDGKESDGKGYLDQQAIVDAARQHGAQAILPGYGFLSENAEFARLVERHGLVFAGPAPDTIEELGLKHRARQLAEAAGVPCVPGSGLLHSADEAVREAARIGYPVMLKASAGGGGLGLQICREAADVESAYEGVVRRARTLFGDADCFLEKYVERSHHIEIQIFGNGLGEVAHFGERECSIQRRHQKVVEEAPSPFVAANPGLREKMTSCATAFGRHARYRSAGTLEFLVDDDSARFYFLEVNTRLQVEHPVTEIVWDVDLVALMLQQADCQLQGRGGIPAEMLKALEQDDVPPRHAVEARVYCENALRDYQPSPGVLQSVRWEHDPRQHRVDGWVSTGTAVTPSYDPLLAKVIGFGKSRDDARKALSSLLERSDVYGPTNIDFLIAVLASDAFVSGRMLTSFLQKDFRFQPAVLEVLEHGLSTSVQDLPGRPEIGHGLPVSGPMDPLSFRLANAIVGNDDTRTEALEITLQGPSLRFHTAAVVALTGAAMELWLDDVPQAMFTKILVPPQSVLRVGNLKGDGGYRAYLAIRHGLPHVPRYLGSKSTCASLGLGGHQGRDLRTGDVLRLAPLQGSSGGEAPFTLPEVLRPPLVSADTSRPTTVYCMRGPYDDEEYLTPAGRASIYQRPMTVSHNVARSGIRFTPDGEMQWARQDGGQGGSHPSNILEFPYSVGGLNWNGNTPVALGVDGPDLGGLLISSTTVSAEYRLGQLSPGLKIQWTPITFEGARELSRRQDAYIAQVLFAARADQSDIEPLSMHLSDQPDVSPILHQTALGDSVMTLRAAGDCCLLVELGEMRADIIVRAKVELMRRTLEKRPMAGVLYVDVNIRTLSIRFDPRLIQQRQLVERVVEVGAQLPSSLETMEKLPCRTWHLPLCFGHPALGSAVDRYKATVRNKAVYLDQSAPGSDNRAYLAQCNGLDERVMEESLLTCPLWTVGIGFFLGTPILLSQDRRTRLRCQKYNPTRLSTPEGAFGWGGSMGAIYGVESPGGYQLVARTLPLWSTYGTAPGFKPDQPWLLSSFDSIQFHKVTVDEYDRSLASLKAGTWKWEVEDKLFDVVEQAQFEASIAEAANQYEAKQSEAIARSEKQERQMYEDWQHDQKQQQQQRQQQQSSSGSDTTAWDWERDPKAIKIKAAMNASVWKVVAQVDEQIKEGGPVVILEAMKTEIPCKADSDMVVKRVIVEPGSLVSTGDVVAVGLPL